MPHETVTLRTCDLIGAALDWAVAKAVTYVDYHGWSPSTDWSQGGPLIHKYLFDFEWVVSDWHGEPIEKFVAAHGYGLDREGIGPDHLIAACRAIVSAHLGDSVDVPAELVGGGHE